MTREYEGHPVHGPDGPVGHVLVVPSTSHGGYVILGVRLDGHVTHVWPAGSEQERHALTVRMIDRVYMGWRRAQERGEGGEAG